MLLEWREEYKIGVASVDYEHQQLIALINDAYEQARVGGANLDVVNFLGEIYARISAHFALEERIMRAHDYDNYTAHKADHERLLDEIRDIMDDYEDSRRFDQAVLGERLHVWFTEHFKTHDARLHHHLGA
jgi:hemerythrin